MILSHLISLADPLNWDHMNVGTGVVMFTKPGKRFEVTLSGSGIPDEIVSLYAGGVFTGRFQNLDMELRKVIL